MKKSWLIGLSSLLTIPFALADIGSTFSNIWWKILSVGNLTFLGMSDGSVVVALVRILIGILIFTILFAVLSGFSKGKDKSALGFLNKNQGMIVAAILAIISAIFMPASVLLAMGTGWATAFALIIIGAPIVGLAFLLWSWPEDGKETKGSYFLKFIICCLLFWIISAMKYHVGRMF